MKNPKAGMAAALLVFATLSLLVIPCIAQPPQPPHTFHGYVYINGSLAPEGVAVSAWVEGTKYAECTTDSEGYYLLIVPVNESTQGKTAKFYVGELYVEGADAVVSPMGLTEQDLSVTDNTSPSIDNLNPEDGATLTESPDTISAAATDPSGVGVDPDSIVMKVDGATVNATYNSATGIVSYSPPEPLGAGSHTVYLGVSDFAGNNASREWDFTIAGVIPPARLTLENITSTTTYVGEPVDLKATVYDEHNNTLEGVSVKLYINGELSMSNASGADGTATFTVEFEEAGTYTTYAKADNVTSNTINITVNEREVESVELTADRTTIYEGDSVEFTANVYAAGDIPIYYRDVKLYINGQLKRTGNTGDSGAATFTIAFNTSGTYTVYAKADGVTSETVEIEVQKIIVVAEVLLAVNVTSVENMYMGYTNQTVEFTATVLDQEEDPVPNMMVDFYLGPLGGNVEKIGSGITDNQGVATLDYVFTSVGIYAAYAEAADVHSGNIYINVTLPPPVVTNVTISADKTEVREDGEVKFTVTVLDQYGSPMAGEQVQLYVDGEVKETGTTNSQGAAVISVKFEEKGEYEVYAESGNVTSDVVTIEVKAREVLTTWVGMLIVASPMIAAVAIIAIALAKRR